MPKEALHYSSLVIIFLTMFSSFNSNNLFWSVPMSCWTWYGELFEYITRIYNYFFGNMAYKYFLFLQTISFFLQFFLRKDYNFVVIMTIKAFEKELYGTSCNKSIEEEKLRIVPHGSMQRDSCIYLTCSWDVTVLIAE